MALWHCRVRTRVCKRRMRAAHLRCLQNLQHHPLPTSWAAELRCALLARWPHSWPAFALSSGCRDRSWPVCRRRKLGSSRASCCMSIAATVFPLGTSTLNTYNTKSATNTRSARRRSSLLSSLVLPSDRERTLTPWIKANACSVTAFSCVDLAETVGHTRMR